MAEIIMNLDNVTVSLSGRVIFERLNWEIQMGQRVGLVGLNGAGKSTLLKLMAEELTADAGNIFRRSGLTWGRLAQEPELPCGQTVLVETLTAVPALSTIETELTRLEQRMGDPQVYGNETALARVMAAHERLLAQFEQLGGPSLHSRAKESLSRLGLGPEKWDTPTDHLSGGEKKLVSLAKLAIQQPELLLLDEPDNHLDVPAKRQLEAFLNSYPGCVVIISHDRYLLDEVATHIAELENGRLNLYIGNYTAYATEREIRRLRQQQLYAAQQKEIARIEAAIVRFELWASMVVNERHIRQARARQKMLDRMDKVEKVSETRRLALDLAGSRGSRKALELVNIRQAVNNGRYQHTLFDNLNFTLWHGERVGLVGDNGAGKSMLLRLILDPTRAENGLVKLGPSCRVGYYAQEHDTLAYERTLIDEIRHNAPLSQEAAVAFLLRFLFTYDQVRGPISNLSGGERSRLQLAKLVLARPNLLLLDEPTNNLDIPAIEVLEATLDEFEGAVLVISHDRYFLDKVVDKVVELRDGRLHEYLGGYTDYLRGEA
jgi:ATP-binding cassette, subfamily F, member 3